MHMTTLKTLTTTKTVLEKRNSVYVHTTYGPFEGLSLSEILRVSKSGIGDW